jgi:hypothetical protein
MFVFVHPWLVFNGFPLEFIPSGFAGMGAGMTNENS